MLVAIADVQIYKYCCSLERKHANELEHPTQAPNATSNGGDASRVGVEKGRKYAKTKKCHKFSPPRTPWPP